MTLHTSSPIRVKDLSITSLRDINVFTSGSLLHLFVNSSADMKRQPRLSAIRISAGEVINLPIFPKCALLHIFVPVKTLLEPQSG